jgi:parallel beta-helix repeat protein
MPLLFGVLVVAALVFGLVAQQPVAHAAPPGGNPSPFLVTRNGNTYTAASQTTNTSYSGTLKSAVESAVADLNGFTAGGTITFSSGTFDFGSDFFVLHDVHDIVFEGQGIDQTIIENVNDAAQDTEPFNFSTATRITIRNMTVSAGGVPRTTSDAIDFDNGAHNVVDHVKIASSRARGIIFDGKGDAGQGVQWAADFNVVSNCIITGTQSAAGDGIEFLGSNNNEVFGCTITNVANNGINAAKASTLAFTANKKSNGNYIHDNLIENAARNGIVINSSDGNRIENNTITNNGDSVAADGIRIDSADSVQCNDNQVAANTATDTQSPKTQQFGLNIADPLCNRTVVGANSLDGNAKDPIQDLGTNTQYLTDTLPFTDGFESGNLSKWTLNSGLVAQQAQVSAGVWAAEGLTNGTGGASGTKQLSPSKNDLYYAIRFKVQSRAASTPINLLRFRNTLAAASPIATLSVTATSRIQLRNDVTSVATLSNTVAADGSWHQAQVHVVVNGTSSQTEVWIDGNAVPELTQNAVNLGTTPVGKIELGDALTTKTYDVFYDEVRAATAFINDVDATAPTAPSGLQATAKSGLEVDLTWTAATDDVAVTGYDIYRNGSLVANIGATTSYADKTAAPLSSYSYKVQARDGAGNLSAFSNTASVTTGDLFADDFESGNLSKWTTVNGLVTQQAEVDPISGAWAARATSDGTAGGASAQVQLDATVNDAYYRARFKLMNRGANPVSLIRVRTAANDALASAFVSSTGKVGYRNDIASTAFTSTQSANQIGWHEIQMHVLVNGASSQIELWLDGIKLAGDTVDLGMAPIGRLELGDPAPTGGRVFDVAFDNVIADPAFIADTTAPSAPTNLRTTGTTASEVDLAWDDASDNVGVTGYRIYRNGVKVGEVDGATLTFADTGLADGTGYTYTVTAVDGVGHESGASNAVQVGTTDTSPPTAPTDLSAVAVAGSNQINLSWTAATDNVAVTGYQIIRNGAKIDEIGAVTTYSDTTTSPGTAYTYTVRAVDAAGLVSPDSNSASASGADTVAPTAPSGLAATVVASDRVDLAWSAATDAVGVTGYRVFRDGVSLGNDLGAAVHTYSDTGAAAGATYAYTVKAFDAAGNVSAASNTATATTFLFSDGFETANLSRWTSSVGLRTESATVFAGSWAAQGTSNKGTTAYAVKQLATGRTNLYYRARILIVGGKPSTVDVLRFRTAGTPGASILTVNYTDKKKLGYRNDVTGTSVVSTTTLNTGVWYEVKAHVVINGAASQVEVWVNGTKVTQLSGTVSLGSASVGAVEIGESVSQRTFDTVFDEVVVDTRP